MKKAILTASIILLHLLSYSQKLYYICELRGYKDLYDGTDLNGRVYADAFLMEWYIEAKVQRLDNTECKIYLKPKELYYGKGPNKGVEVIIEISKEQISQGEVNIKAVAVNKKNAKWKCDLDNITLKQVQASDSTLYINEKTFKHSEPIMLRSPEEVTVQVITAYINDRLYNIDDSIGGFKNILHDLQGYKNFTTKKQIYEAFKLYNFIEPYLRDDSYLNSEAEKLKDKLDKMKKEVKSDSMEVVYNLTLKVFKNFQILSEDLNKYIKSLEIILYVNNNLVKDSKVKFLLDGNYRVGYVFEKKDINYAIDINMMRFNKTTLGLDYNFSLATLNSKSFFIFSNSLVFENKIFNINKGGFYIRYGPSFIYSNNSDLKKLSTGLNASFLVFSKRILKSMFVNISYTMIYDFLNKKNYSGFYYGVSKGDYLHWNEILH